MHAPWHVFLDTELKLFRPSHQATTDYRDTNEEVGNVTLHRAQQSRVTKADTGLLTGLTLSCITLVTGDCLLPFCMIFFPQEKAGVKNPLPSLTLTCLTVIKK